MESSTTIALTSLLYRLSIKVLDANIMEDDSLEVIRSTGTLVDADVFYNSHKSIK